MINIKKLQKLSATSAKRDLLRLLEALPKDQAYTCDELAAKVGVEPKTIRQYGREWNCVHRYLVDGKPVLCLVAVEKGAFRCQ